MRWLQSSPFKTAIINNRNELIREWRACIKSVPRLAEVHTLSEYLWAASIVQSRSFALATEKEHNRCGAVSEKALVPLADLLNHRKEGDYSVSWGFDLKLDGFVLKAVKPLSPGAALTDSYGETKTAAQFVRMYGFTPTAQEKGVSENSVGRPAMLTRSLNASFANVLEILQRLNRLQINSKDRASNEPSKNGMGGECQEPDSGRASTLLPLETSSKHTAEHLGEQLAEQLSGMKSRRSSVFPLRAKLSRATHRTPSALLYMEDARIMAFLRGVSEAYLSGFAKALESRVIPGKHLRGAGTEPRSSAEARTMYCEVTAGTAALNAMKASQKTVMRVATAAAEELAARVFAALLEDALRSYGTSLEEDEAILRHSSKQDAAATRRAEEAEVLKAETESMQDEIPAFYKAEAFEETETPMVMSYNQLLALRLRIGEKRLLTALQNTAREEASLLQALARTKRAEQTAEEEGSNDAGGEMTQERESISDQAPSQVEETYAAGSSKTHRRSSVEVDQAFAAALPKHIVLMPELLRAIGKIVWGKWKKGNFWYKGYVAAVWVQDQRAAGEPTFTIKFDDGDIEEHVIQQHILWGSDPVELGLDGVRGFGDKFKGRVMRQ